MNTRIYAMNAQGRDFTEERFLPYVSEGRRQEARKRRKDRDRQLYLAAEVLLNRSLQLEGRSLPLPVPYTRNPYGKPCLPKWAGRYANWSHSGTWVICVLSDREAGIDLQEAGKEPKEALIHRTLQPEELAFYEQAPADRKKRLFYEYWVLKESFLKSKGTGFHTSLDTFYIEMGNGAPEAVQRAGGPLYTCRLLDFADQGYAAALCVEGEEDPGELRIEYL